MRVCVYIYMIYIYMYTRGWQFIRIHADGGFAALPSGNYGSSHVLPSWLQDMHNSTAAWH